MAEECVVIINYNGGLKLEPAFSVQTKSAWQVGAKSYLKISSLYLV